ncbi:MAG: prolipoprotein diacylglyceryl transferase [Ruminococcaceae bacterium]|nr:prolipoprotein diacylglyceryl transferase [Oscillospiraceae bacterium]
MYPYIHIFGRTLGTYGILMAVACLLVGVIASRRVKQRGAAAEDVVIVGATAVGVGLLCGAILYFLVTYPLDVLLQAIITWNFDGIGIGIVFYGALIGGVFGALLGCRIAKCNTGAIIRSIVPYIPLGHGIGRIGCILGGCCYGFAGYTGPLAIYYPHHHTGAQPGVGYFPVQLVEAFINIFITIFLVRFEKKCKRAWDVLFAYLASYAVVRFCLEYLRGDAIRGLFSGVSTSQWISIGLLAISAGYFIIVNKKHR